MKCELTLRDLWEVIEPDATTGIASHVTLHKKDAKAQALILVNIEESYQVMVEDMDGAKSMWNFLERLFKAKSRDRAVDLWREFFTAKQQSSETAMQFVARVEARARELREACKQTVSDEMLSGVIVEGVLPAYTPVVEALRISKSLTVVNLKDELVTADNRLDKQRSQDAELLAAAAQLQRPQQALGDGKQRQDDRECFYCGKKGGTSKEAHELLRMMFCCSTLVLRTTWCQTGNILQLLQTRQSALSSVEAARSMQCWGMEL